MQKWEYCVLRYTSGSIGNEAVFIGSDGARRKIPHRDEGFLQELNRLGAEGWEVVSYGNSESKAGTYREAWTLKRPTK